jgi:hypothetical protein
VGTIVDGRSGLWPISVVWLPGERCLLDVRTWGLGRSLPLPAAAVGDEGQLNPGGGGDRLVRNRGSVGVVVMFPAEYRPLAIDFPPKPVTLGDSRFPRVDDARVVVCSPFAVLC